jgi:dTDP-4-dehydrorhamnose reductase
MAMRDNSIAILGGRGMLGSDLVTTCRKQGLDPIVLDLPEFDITNSDHLKKAVSSAQIIVNCAAYTNVDGAESEAELAYQINGEAVGCLGFIAREAGKWVLHISTDFVFDGRSKRPYIETDPPNPISTYGRTKLAGEQLLAQSECRHCVIRVEWTYGSAGNHFIGKIMQRAKKGELLKIVDDQIGSPTATTEVAGAICKLLHQQPEGIYHFANAGYVSRYNMARFVFEKLPMEADLLPCKTSDYNTPAARPLNSRFDCSKIEGLLGESIELWQVPLERFLRKL